MLNLLVLPSLRKWIVPLAQSFSKPQTAHLLAVLLGVLLRVGPLTLERVRRIAGQPSCLSALTRFLDTNQWTAEALWWPVRRAMLAEAIRRARCRARNRRVRWRKKKGRKVKRIVPRPIPVFLSLDDTLLEKPPASQHLEGFAWHWDHNQKKTVWALCVVTVNVQIGGRVFPAAFEVYLPRKAVHQLRQRYPHLGFVKKTDLAQSLLRTFEGLFPPDRFSVTVLMDSFYSSNKILNYCRRQQWTAIAAIKKNRILDGKRVDHHARTPASKDWERVSVPNTSGTKTQTYRVVLLTGHLQGVRGRGSVVTSKRGRRDRSPKYFFSTDPTLSAQEILARYAKRWHVELDYFFLKEKLGLGDFRIRKWGAIRRYLTIVFVALCWLQHYRWHRGDGHNSLPTLADTMAHCRRELTLRRLRAVYRLAQQNYSSLRIVTKLFADAA